MVCAQVLVVEDEKIVARALQDELRNMGYSVPDIASTGEEAIEKACENHPDIVLMDIVLRGPLDGIETAQRLRHRLDVPVVYLTAYSDEETVSRARSTQPFGYLLKPYEEKELRTTIEMTLAKHRVERQLKETNQWLSATLRSVDNAVIATDGRQYVRLMNPVAAIMTGWKPAEAVGRDLLEVCTILNSNRRNLLLSLGTQALLERRGIHFTDDSLAVSRGGTTAPVEGCLAPLYDDDDQFTGLVLVFRDVSERKQVEKLQRQSEDHLRNSQKMEAVSRLAGGVAHDFNKLLTDILGDVGQILAHMPADDPNLERATRIEAATRRAADVVDHLTAFSGRAPAQPAPVNLNDLAAEVAGALRTGCDPRITINCRLAGDAWPLRADRAQLLEMLRNLCLNAREAMPDGGRLTVETANCTVQDDHLRLEWQAQPGDFVRLRVSDTGRGMTPETRSRIFEPFFTSKEAGDGLGLALVHGIVQEHGGWIECYSEPGQGTTFDVYLPRHWSAPVEPAADVV